MLSLETFDKHILSYLQNSSISPTRIVLIHTLVIFIFCLIVAYKTGISDLPNKYYKKAYNYNKESKKLSIHNLEVKKSIDKLNKEMMINIRKLYKNKLKFERQAYSLLSNELTKESYNEEIEELAEKASDIVSEANSIIEDVYGFED